MHSACFVCSYHGLSWSLTLPPRSQKILNPFSSIRNGVLNNSYEAIPNPLRKCRLIYYNDIFARKRPTRFRYNMPFYVKNSLTVLWAITCSMAPSGIISYYNTINIYTISDCLKIILLKLYMLKNVKKFQHSLPTLILKSSAFSLPNLIMISFHKKQL